MLKMKNTPKRRRLIAMAAAVAVAALIAIPGTAFASSFPDVPDNHWAQRAGYIDFANDRGCIKGYDSGNFGPDDNMTRGQMAVVIYRMLYPIPDPTDSTKTVYARSSDYLNTYLQNTNFQKYSDLRNWATDTINSIYYGKYYNIPCRYAYEMDIMDGGGTRRVLRASAQYGDYTYKGTSEPDLKPEQAVTREELCTMLYRIKDLAQRTDTNAINKTINSFADPQSVSTYAVDTVNWAIREGIITGKNDTHIDGKALVTRAEAAKMWAVFLKGYGFEPLNSDKQWVQGGYFGYDNLYTCSTFFANGCGASALTKDSIVHEKDCQAAANGTAKIDLTHSESYWHPYNQIVLDEDKVWMKEHQLLTGWYDYV